MSSAEATVVVTLDIGGSAAKASAYDAAREVCLGSTAVPYPPSTGQDPGMFDPDGLWSAAVGALRDLRQLAGEPAGRYLAITVSAIRIPFVLLDAQGNAVMPGLLNRDRRATPQVAGLTAAIGADELYGITGHWPAPEFGLPKLLWVRDQYPDAWRATRTVLQLHDWFVYRLSGVLASERSSAGMSQMIDVRNGGWSAGVLAALNIPESLLPELRRAGAPAGRLLPDVARASGFAAGTPVHIGGGDTHMSALSAQPAQQARPGPSPVCPVVVAGSVANYRDPVRAAVWTVRLPILYCGVIRDSGSPYNRDHRCCRDWPGRSRLSALADHGPANRRGLVACLPESGPRGAVGLGCCHDWCSRRRWAAATRGERANSPPDLFQRHRRPDRLPRPFAGK